MSNGNRSYARANSSRIRIGIEILIPISVSVAAVMGGYYVVNAYGREINNAITPKTELVGIVDIAYTECIIDPLWDLSRCMCTLSLHDAETSSGKYLSRAEVSLEAEPLGILKEDGNLYFQRVTKCELIEPGDKVQIDNAHKILFSLDNYFADVLSPTVIEPN